MARCVWQHQPFLCLQLTTAAALPVGGPPVGHHLLPQQLLLELVLELVVQRCSWHLIRQMQLPASR
jgi:hypothetical protein